LLDSNYFFNKEYKVPDDCSASIQNKYKEVIEEGYAPYIDIIYNCGFFIMQKQLEKLIAKNDNNMKTNYCYEKKAYNMIKYLEKKDFIKSEFLNKSKYIYLRNISFGIPKGKHKNNERIDLRKSLKNDNFRISILRMEHFINYDEILSIKMGDFHLYKITKQILKKIKETNNAFGYDLELIEEILHTNTIRKVKELLDRSPEYRHKLDAIRSLWVGMGSIFVKMLSLREALKLEPDYYKTFVNEDGRVFIHYIPNIVMYNVSKDNKFFENRVNSLFNDFKKIDNNNLFKIREDYEKYNYKKTGVALQNVFGYKLTIIGENKKRIENNKIIIDELVESNNSTPCMKPVEIIHHDTENYYIHQTSKNNKYRRYHEEQINRILNEKIRKVDDLVEKKENKVDDVEFHDYLNGL
jgi:hypothetical protein